MKNFFAIPHSWYWVTAIGSKKGLDGTYYNYRFWNKGVNEIDTTHALIECLPSYPDFILNRLEIQFIPVQLKWWHKWQIWIAMQIAGLKRRKMEEEDA